MHNWTVRSPQTAAEWQAYYHLRWQVLREPWGQPVGSERDELEQSAIHIMLLDSGGLLAAVGRLHLLDSEQAQVRYMAVSSEQQGKGYGARVLQALEMKAAEQGCQSVVLNAREHATGFYRSRGYQEVSDLPALFGIPHVRMQKRIRLPGQPEHFQDWIGQLQHIWHTTIPLSQFMQLTVAGFDGHEFRCQAPLEPNINLHQTMFAGSIYTLATLTGWGLQYLYLRSENLQGDQVLAEANIRYFKPVSELPQARCYVSQTDGSLERLHKGKKAVQKITVEILSGSQVTAEFSGRYVVLPHQIKTS